MSTASADIETDPESQARLERSRMRLVARPDDRERRVERIAGLLFLPVALAFAILVPHRGLSVDVAAVVVLAYALSLRVEFEVGSGYTVPSIVVFVPMLFLVPAPLVPLCVVAASLLNYLVNVALGRRHRARMFVVLGQAWHAMGAALVFALASPGAAGWDDLPVTLIAFAAYVALDATASLAVDHYAHRERLGSLVSSALWIYFVDLLLLPIGLTIAVAAGGDPLALAPIVPLFALLAMFAGERRRRIDHVLELSRAYRGTAMLLGDVVESDDSYTGSHSRDVVELAVEVGQRLGLDATQLRNLEFGALLHDVGKIAVPKEILHKPGQLDNAEWAVMRRHTIEGQQMLESVGGVLADVGFVVRCSHEHFDGSGYPDGLANDAIPIEARICCASDAFSAMTTDRSYRPAMPEHAAVAELRRCAGSQFDPTVVEALLEVLAEPARLRHLSTRA